MRLDTWHAPPGDRIPNHPRFPVLAYHDVEAAQAGPDAARRLFAEHGWGGSWVDGVFGFHHFHSTSHEVLAVVAGSATLELGGPQGEAFEVWAGDVLVLPAGTGHRRAAADRAFSVVGAYPAGQEDYDILRGDDPAELRRAKARIAALPAPPYDPVGGAGISTWNVTP
jgi:uncharacterized protein YjlB